MMMMPPQPPVAPKPPAHFVSQPPVPPIPVAATHFASPRQFASQSQPQPATTTPKKANVFDFPQTRPKAASSFDFPAPKPKANTDLQPPRAYRGISNVSSDGVDSPVMRTPTGSLTSVYQRPPSSTVDSFDAFNDRPTSQPPRPQPPRPASNAKANNTAFSSFDAFSDLAISSPATKNNSQAFHPSPNN